MVSYMHLTQRNMVIFLITVNAPSLFSDIAEYQPTQLELFASSCLFPRNDVSITGTVWKEETIEFLGLTDKKQNVTAVHKQTHTNHLSHCAGCHLGLNEPKRFYYEKWKLLTYPATSFAFAIFLSPSSPLFHFPCFTPGSFFASPPLEAHFPLSALSISSPNTHLCLHCVVCYDSLVI